MGCQGYVEGYTPGYGYLPSLAAGIVFCVLFGGLMILHGIQSIRARNLSSLLLAVGCLGEALGWFARAWASRCPYEMDIYMLQSATLILAPNLFSAATYLFLGHLILVLGQGYSCVSSRAYLSIFYICDIVSLAIQGAGGGMVSSAISENNGNVLPGATADGTHVIIAGIVFQLVSTTGFMFCVVDFLRRAIRAKEWHEARRATGASLVAITIVTMCIYIRGIYRTVEMFGGFRGYLVVHEVYFVVLDGVVMAIAASVFVFFPPGSLLARLRGSIA